MPKAYSLDLRQRVARVVEGGRSCHAAAAHFSVSVSFVVRLMKSLRATDADNDRAHQNPISYAGGAHRGPKRLSLSEHRDAE
jgi:transposase